MTRADRPSRPLPIDGPDTEVRPPFDSTYEHAEMNGMGTSEASVFTAGY